MGPPWQRLRKVGSMNENHARVCGSKEWAEHIQGDVLPALTAGADLGADLLEIGPGPGAATDWLRHKVERLVAVEVDADAAGALAGRFAGGNVTIAAGDATALEFADESFDSVGCFTMLHHVPARGLQGQILAEAYRVLRPGGVMIGSDSLGSAGLHDFHEGDAYNPVDPAWLLSRLQDLGFSPITVTVDWMLKFVARKPDGEQQAD
jgi:SAM-dependent methyltransferase